MTVAAYVIDTDVLSKRLLGDATAVQFFESIQNVVRRAASEWAGNSGRPIR